MLLRSVLEATDCTTLQGRVDLPRMLLRSMLEATDFTRFAHLTLKSRRMKLTVLVRHSTSFLGVCSGLCATRASSIVCVYHELCAPLPISNGSKIFLPTKSYPKCDKKLISLWCVFCVISWSFDCHIFMATAAQSY